MKVSYSIDNAVGTITLANPPCNLFDSPVFADENKLRGFLSDPSLFAVIIEGAGRHFSAGADTDKLRDQAAHADFPRQFARGKALLEIIASATVPVCAVIRGSCFGAGLELALACHFRFAASSSMLGFPESDHGFMPGFGGTVRSGRFLRQSHCVDLIVSGRIIGADEARSLGLVDRVCRRATVRHDAAAYLRELTRDKSPRLIRAIMASIRNGATLPLADALREETRLFCSIVAEDRYGA